MAQKPATPKKPILVIGDLIIDIHREGEKLGLSAETPTLVARDKARRLSFGGAGLVVRNILALGGKVTFLTIIGEDERGEAVRKWSDKNLSLSLFTEDGRTTTAKERMWVDGYKLLQWDYLDNRPISKKTEDAIVAFVEKNIGSFHKLIISDYRHGLLTESLAEELLLIAKKAKKEVYIDSQVSQRASNHVTYKGADLFCVNTKEAIAIDPRFQESDLEISIKNLAELLQTQNIIVKMGEKGSANLIEGKFFLTKAASVEARDTTGAGDAFLAALSVGHGVPTREDIEFANLWAGLATTTKGPEPATLAMLKEILKK